MLLELLLLIQMSKTTPVVQDAQLSQLAVVRSEQVYNQGYSSENWYKTFDSTNCFHRGEVVGQDFEDAEYFIQKIDELEKGRANLVNPKMGKVGIGQYKDITTILFCGEVGYYKNK